jgi:hypothetical protein
LQSLRNSTFPHAILSKTCERFVRFYEKFGLRDFEPFIQDNVIIAIYNA